MKYRSKYSSLWVYSSILYSYYRRALYVRLFPPNKYVIKKNIIWYKKNQLFFSSTFLVNLLSLPINHFGVEI